MIQISSQLPDKRWAVLIDGKVAAYISCFDTYQRLKRSLLAFYQEQSLVSPTTEK